MNNCNILHIRSESEIRNVVYGNNETSAQGEETVKTVLEVQRILFDKGSIHLPPLLSNNNVSTHPYTIFYLALRPEEWYLE